MHGDLEQSSISPEIYLKRSQGRESSCLTHLIIIPGGYSVEAGAPAARWQAGLQVIALALDQGTAAPEGKLGPGDAI